MSLQSSGFAFACKWKTRGRNFQIFQFNPRQTRGTDPANFWDVCMENMAAVDDIVQADLFLYDIDIIDVPMIGELARRSVGKYSDIVRLLRYKSHVCHMSDFNAPFKAYCCPSFDQIIKKTEVLGRHLTSCRETTKHVFPENVYRLPETLFDKLDSFNNRYSDDQKLFKNMAIFELESICVQGDKSCLSDTTTCIVKHVLISVPFLSQLIDQTIFLCNFNPWALVESCVDALNELATQSKAQVNLQFLNTEISVKSKFNQLFSTRSHATVAGNQFWKLKMEVLNKKSKMNKKCGHSLHSLCKRQKINLLICRVTSEDFAIFFQSLASTAQSKTLI